MAETPPIALPFRVLELGDTLAVAVCGRMFAELDADIVAIRDTERSSRTGDLTRFAVAIDKRYVPIATPSELSPTLKRLAANADLIVVGGRLRDLEASGTHPDALRGLNPSATVVAITPFGLTGPRKDDSSTDLIAFHSSGIALRMAGRVDDPDVDPPTRASGEQSEFIAGVTAACAAMSALYERQASGSGQLIDVSIEEALACQAMDELARPAAGKEPSDRVRPLNGGGVVITVLKASDGWLAVSPREDHQWKAWAGVLGRPDFATGPDFGTRDGRIAHWDELYEFMCAWSTARTSEQVIGACKEAHIPCFPFGSPSEMLALPQLEHRSFFRFVSHPVHGPLKVPGPAHDLGSPRRHATSVSVASEDIGWKDTGHLGKPSLREPELPLDGIRVLDFSWVIAGPTCTRYLAAMGAEVIKVENPNRPDPGRGSELHAVLGQSKRGIALDLKDANGLDAALRLAKQSDVVVENFATGVMERLGLGYEALRERRQDIVLLSASGLGRTGPEAQRPAYGNLLSAFTGFAELNNYPGRPPATGMAWADPLCGLMMAFSIIAALHDRRGSGLGRHIDFSMIEALLWGMPGPLIEAQLGSESLTGLGNGHERFAPHGVYRCSGNDDWVAVAVTTDAEWWHLVEAVPGLREFEELNEAERRASSSAIDERIATWARARTGLEAADALRPNVPASASRSSLDLFHDPHLLGRGFYEPHATESDGPTYPRIPWLADGMARPPTPAATLGQHTAQVLCDVAGLTDAEIERLAESGALA